MIKWKRSDEGFCDSKCGRFSIQPFYWSCVKPQSYGLWDSKLKKRIGAFYDTQKDAKNAAEYYLRNLSV